MQKQNKRQPNTLKKGTWIIVEDFGLIGSSNCLIHTCSIERVTEGEECLFIYTHLDQCYGYQPKNLKKFQMLLNDFEE